MEGGAEEKKSEGIRGGVFPMLWRSGRRAEMIRLLWGESGILYPVEVRPGLLLASCDMIGLNREPIERRSESDALLLVVRVRRRKVRRIHGAL